MQFQCRFFFQNRFSFDKIEFVLQSMNTVSLIFGFLLSVLLVIDGNAQSIEPLIDSPGKTIGSDFNGDGIHDFIVGARLNDAGANNGGAAFIFFGASTLSGTQSLGEGQSADMTIAAKTASDYVGVSVASAGDLNGDGLDDIIVGADGYDAVYIIFGSTSLSGTTDLGAVGSADVTIIGKAAGDLMGLSVSGAGDVNGDGFDDFMLEAYGNDDAGNVAGAAYVFFGSATLSGTKRLGAGESADVTILGKLAVDFLGKSVSGAGDVNGDGFDDFMVGALGNDDGGASYTGAAYIFFGASDLSGTKSLGAGQSADVTMLGKASNDKLGTSVSGAGDVNGDGFDDVIVGAYQNNDGGTDDEGAAYIFFGASNVSGTKDTGNAPLVIGAPVIIQISPYNDVIKSIAINVPSGRYTLLTQSIDGSFSQNSEVCRCYSPEAFGPT